MSSPPGSLTGRGMQKENKEWQFCPPQLPRTDPSGHCHLWTLSGMSNLIWKTLFCELAVLFCFLSFFFFFPIFSRIPSILSESTLGVRSLPSTSICQYWSPSAMGVDSGSPEGSFRVGVQQYRELYVRSCRIFSTGGKGMSSKYGQYSVSRG